MAVSIEVDADLRRFLSSIDGLSDAASDEARQIAHAFDRELSKVSVSTGNVAKTGKINFNELGNVAEKALKKMGSAGGEVADVLFDFGLPLAEMASGFGTAGTAAVIAGGAVTAIGVAAGLAAAAVVSIVNAATAARDRLEEAGLAAEIPAEAQASLDAYEESSTKLGQEFDRLTVIIGSKLAPIVTAANEALASLAHWMSETASETDAATTELDEWNESVRLSAESTAALAGGFDFDALFAANGIDVATDASKALAAANAAASASATKLGQDQAAAMDAIVVRAGPFGDALRSQFAAVALAAKLAAERGEKEYIESFAAIGEAADRAMADVKRKFEETAASIQAISDGAGKLVTGITDLIISSYEAQAAAGVDLSDQQKRAANEAAIVQKIAAIGMITVNAAVALAGIVANLAPLIGPGAIAVAAAVVGGMLSSLAGVIGQPLPFPDLGGGGGANGMSGSGGEPITEDDLGPGPAPGQGENYKDDGQMPDIPGKAGAAKRSAAVQISLSRTAAQLLQLAPPGKTFRGVR